MRLATPIRIPLLYARARRLRGVAAPRCRRRVLLRIFPQVLAIHELIVELAAAHAAHDLGEIDIDGLIREQPLIQLALHLLRERRPIATHDFHADELDGIERAAVS